ncbi:gamma-interferon-responsive lysosomal thiol protein-like [Vigna unguiculata]|uniref:Interferon n=1 Tax=Vigna unguiculata TaxID=3917 RepID=A0A4D6KTB8_VIGUN|nr:gamma-interferon-responsive lysosomal thiol protein-like [Vigna unguiculata]QCD77831.1 interferon [Vigna unguiculata]
MVSRSTTLFVSLLLHLLFFTFFSQSESKSQPPNVSLELYYESLCPYSANFIVNHLPKIFTTDLIPVVDLKFVPWGNAKLRPNATINCQHGPNECLLNTVEACAIDTWPELGMHFLFIYCVEDMVHQRRVNEWESCFETLHLDSEPIKQCYNSEHGKQLELQYAAETDALQPPHKYVPWVVVDGEPLYEDYENFLSYICKAYKGTDTPKSCTKVSYLTEVKAKNEHSVCDKEGKEPTWRKLSSTMSSWLHKMNLGDAF